MTAPTVDVDVNRDRTAAATAARRQAKAERLAAELVARLDALPKPLLAALTVQLLAECERRRAIRPAETLVRTQGVRDSAQDLSTVDSGGVAPVRFSDSGGAR